MRREGSVRGTPCRTSGRHDQGGLRLADAIAPEFRAAVLSATFCGLRLGEVRALRHQELSDGTLILGPPKTDAGVRTIVIPQVIIPDLEHHLASVPLGGTLYTAWRRATTGVGITGLRFHDLRHTGNTFAASTGASTKELMSRMGQSSSRAALLYQHATQDRDAVIANSLSSMITEHRFKSSRGGLRRPSTGGQATFVDRMWRDFASRRSLLV